MNKKYQIFSLEEINEWNTPSPNDTTEDAVAATLYNNWSSGIQGKYTESEFNDCIEPFNKFAFDYTNATSEYQN